MYQHDHARARRRDGGVMVGTPGGRHGWYPLTVNSKPSSLEGGVGEQCLDLLETPPNPYTLNPTPNSPTLQHKHHAPWNQTLKAPTPERLHGQGKTGKGTHLRCRARPNGPHTCLASPVGQYPSPMVSASASDLPFAANLLRREKEIKSKPFWQWSSQRSMFFTSNIQEFVQENSLPERV